MHLIDGDVYNLIDFIEPRLNKNLKYEDFIMCMDIQEQVDSNYFKRMFVSYSKQLKKLY